MVSFRFAGAEHIPQMKALWHGVFGDSMAYIQQFYCHWNGIARCIVALEQEQVIGMAHLIPAYFIENGVVRPCCYLYAGAVKPGYRGNGIFQEIFHHIFQELEKNDTLAIMLPASDSLFSYYGKLGCRPIPLCSILSYKQKEKPAAGIVSVSDLQKEDFLMLRKKFVEQLGCATLWGRNGLGYVLAEFSFFGGTLKKITFENREYAMVAAAHSDILDITELTALPEEYDRLFPAICGAFGYQELRCRVPYRPELPPHMGMVWTAGDRIPGDIYFPFDFC